MSSWETAGALLIALVLGGTLAFIFWKENRRAKNEANNRGRQDAGRNEQAVNGLQLQLQAYERLILLTERIALPNLISRINEPGVEGKDMQLMLTHTIKQEFDHNITQQLYISAEAWEAVRNLKEQNIHIINQVAGFLPPDISGTELNKKLLEMIAENPKVSLHHVVAEVLSYETKKLLK